jgi:ABC-type transporter Mla MlaB component
MAVKKKTSRKKASAKKAPVKTGVDSSVMAHDPLSMLEEAANMLQQGVDDDFDSDLSAADEVAVTEVVSPLPVESAGNMNATAALNAAVEPEPESQAAVVSPVADEYDLGDSITIADVEKHKRHFLDLLTIGTAIKLSAADISQCDGAGLQLLSAFYKEAMSRGVELNWGRVSKDLHAAVTVMGLIDSLGLADADIDDDGEGVSWGLF